MITLNRYISILTATIVCAYVFLTTPASAEIVTFVKEYTYQASELDSKASCRTISLEMVKRLLLEELGTYLENETIVTNYQVTKDEIRVISAGTVKTKIIEEKWDGKSYWLKVEMKADSKEVEQGIRAYRENINIGQEAINANLKKVESSLNEISELKRKVKTIKSAKDKQDIKEEYMLKVNALSDGEIEAKAVIAHDIDQNYDETIRLGESLINRKAGSYLLHCLVGSAYHQKKMYEKALSMYQECLGRTPPSAFVHNAIAKTYNVKGEHEKAIIEANKALAISNDEKKIWDNETPSKYFSAKDIQRNKDLTDDEITESKGWIIMAYIGIAANNSKRSTPPSEDDPITGIPDETFTLAKEIISLKPSEIVLFNMINMMNLVKYDEQSFKDMIAWCDKLILLNPSNIDLYDKRSVYLLTLSKIDTANSEYWITMAIEARSKAMELDPNNANMYIARASAHLSRNDYIKAIKDYDMAIRLEPNNEEGYIFRGASYSSIGIHGQAIKNFDKAIELNPLKDDYYHARGYSYAMLELHQQAIKDFDKAIDLNPLKGDHYCWRGYSYAKLKNNTQAINDFKAAARLGNKDAQDLLLKEGIKW